MCAIAILNKKERRENRADNTSKRQYNEGNQAKACQCIMCGRTGLAIEIFSFL